MANPSKALRDFEKTIASLEKRHKSRIFSIIHTADPHHICGPETYKLLQHRDRFSGINTLEILIILQVVTHFERIASHDIFALTARS